MSKADKEFIIIMSIIMILFALGILLLGVLVHFVNNG